MIKGIRGLAQAFVRSAVSIGRKSVETYQMLTEAGLGYVEEQFKMDWSIYDEQKGRVSVAMELDRSQLIHGHLHGESPQNLTAKFKYDVKAVYEDIKGDTLTKHWSVINNERMTLNEVLDYAQMFAEDYAPEEFPMHAQPELTGIWTRPQAGLA